MELAVIDTFDNAVRNWGAQLSWPAEQLLRLMLAAVAGGLVGIEREIRGRHAGFRTNLLVAVGSALVMLVSISFAETGSSSITRARMSASPLNAIFPTWNSR